jgi:glycosyltransferase involved in cell wall biosynthesis
MVACSNAGVTYWRMYSWWIAAHRTQKAFVHVLGWDKDELEHAPWQFQIAEAEHQPKLFGMLYQAGAEADAIVFQRVSTDAALTCFYAMKDQFPNKPILTELDDDITDVAPYNQASEFFRPGSDLTRIALSQIENSDGLIVSTPYLREVYSEYCPHIYVVPNSIDTPVWDKAKRKKRSGIRIGWIGGASHAEDLKLMESVIPKVIAHNRDVRFVFISSALPESIKAIKGVEAVEKWSPILRYPSHLASMGLDIGIAPLRDNKFNRAKSNLRWLEYSALGLPCVASRVGHFEETIKDGEDGLLASNPDEFTRHLISLVDSKKLRKKIGAAAHARISLDFNVDVNLDIYLDALKECIARPPRKAPSLMTGVDEVPEISPLEVLPQATGTEAIA